MKKFVLAILAAVAFTGVQAQAFPDIPANHWAGEAVQRIADLGIVIGFPDGTYRGNEGFTRYQAALVISRLLDVIRADMDAMKALTDADIASLRNALQELASDVAAQDVRLSAVEGAVASISDDTASNTARIEALEAGMGMSADMQAALQDLQNQIDAARVAADTAQSTADAAAAAAQAAQDQSAQNAAAIDAINDLLALLADDIANLGQPAAVDLSGIQGQVDRNTSDIANIREFVILLRRDQVALRDRVAALEASDASQQAAIDDLTARVTKIEEDLFTISGSIALTYKAYRLSGAGVPFDADRVWGLNADRNIGDSRFSSGEKDINEKDGIESGNGEKKQDRQDIENTEGEVDAVLTLNVGFGTARNGAGDPRALNTFETVIELGLTKVTGPTLYTGDDKDVEISNPYIFSVKSFKTTFDPIGAAPLTFQFGEKTTAEFTKYVFDAGVGAGDGEGFVATVGSPDFLAFLSPTLTIAYGEVDKSVDAYELEPFDVNGDGTISPGETRIVDRVVASDGVRKITTADKLGDLDIYPGAYYRAIRGTLSPLQGETLSATGGFSFAQLAMNAQDNADAAANNLVATVWGLDAQIGISVVDIKAEYANSSAATTAGGAVGFANFPGKTPTAAGNTVGDKARDPININPSRGSGQSLFYVTADVDVAGLGIPVLKSLNANYRMIPNGWDGLDDEKDYPFVEDQSGFAVKATLGLFILDPVTAYFDSYTTTVDNTTSGGTAATTDTSVSAFGVDATINLFSAFSITGFFHSLTVDGQAANSAASPINGSEEKITIDKSATFPFDTDPKSVKRGTDYDTGFGVKLGHDGASENALVPNLNLSAEYKQTEADFSKRTIDLNADYTLKVSIVELTPYAGFKSVNDADTGSDDTNTIKVGTGVKTDELGIIFKPSLNAAVNYRTTSHTDVTTPYTATELQWAVGVNFGEFLFPNSTLSARYGSWAGTNVKGAKNSTDAFDVTVVDGASNISDGDTLGSGNQSASGYEIAWDYYDLVFTYGAYNNVISGSTLTGAGNIANGSTGSQAFRIAYTVKF
jgi:predicted  nucleic acid-binding Zn-ribbon protein